MATTDVDQTPADDASRPQPDTVNEGRAAEDGLPSGEAGTTAGAEPAPDLSGALDAALAADPAEGPDPAPVPAAAADPASVTPVPQMQATTARDLFTGPRARAFALLGGVVLLVLVLALSPLPAWLGGLSQSSAFQTVANTAQQAQTDAGQGSPATAKAAAGTPTTANPADGPAAATTAPATGPAEPDDDGLEGDEEPNDADEPATDESPEAGDEAEAAPEAQPAQQSRTEAPAASQERPAPQPAQVPAPAADPAPAAEPKLVHVTVVIDGTAAGEQYYSVHVELEPGQTAYDALVASGANVNARATVYGTYVAAIDGLAEMAHGPMSGWVYAIDGVEPNVAASGRIMRDGQTLVWTYVNVEY